MVVMKTVLLNIFFDWVIQREPLVRIAWLCYFQTLRQKPFASTFRQYHAKCGVQTGNPNLSIQMAFTQRKYWNTLIYLKAFKQGTYTLVTLHIFSSSGEIWGPLNRFGAEIWSSFRGKWFNKVEEFCTEKWKVWKSCFFLCVCPDLSPWFNSFLLCIVIICICMCSALCSLCVPPAPSDNS